MAKSYPQGIRLDKPKEGSREFVKGRVGVEVAKFGQWCRENANEKGWVNFDLLEGMNGLYFQHWKPDGEAKPKEDARPYVKPKDEAPDDMDEDLIPF